MPPNQWPDSTRMRHAAPSFSYSNKQTNNNKQTENLINGRPATFYGYTRLARSRRLDKSRIFNKRLFFMGFALVYVLIAFTFSQYNMWKNTADVPFEMQVRGPMMRKLLSKTTSSDPLLNSTSSNSTNTTIAPNKEEHDCVHPSIKEFPKDIFKNKTRQYGAVLLHVFCAFYMFVALASVCDDYFISALDKICERLDLSEDVAGATFMAAGSSAPELFTSLIGVFLAKSDVGVGTIVGSAVFNILVIIALCCLFAGQVVYLTKWPLIRDSACYCISIGALIWTIYDGKVVWYEALTMLLLYLCYIILMKFNPVILKQIDKCCKPTSSSSEVVKNGGPNAQTVLMQDGEVKVNVIAVNNGGYQQENQDTSFAGGSHNTDGSVLMVNPSVEDQSWRPSSRLNGAANNNKGEGEYDEEMMKLSARKRLTWKELGMMIMLTDRFAPSSRFRAACLIVILRGDHQRTGGQKSNVYKVDAEDNNINHNGSADPEAAGEAKEGDGEEDIGSPFLFPSESVLKTLAWILSLPLIVILYFTIPDCRKKRWENWYVGTFLMSIFWIMAFSYLLVWMVSVIGYTIGIPDIIMGIIFLAAGTSIPDAISSLLVAREGMGDMAVSNSIGSNVFDILLGLAFPWFLSCLTNKAPVVVNSKGMVFSVWLLFGSVLLTVLLIHCNKWRLTKPLGGFFVMIYVVFVSISVLIEFNVFGKVNNPPCICTDC